MDEMEGGFDNMYELVVRRRSVDDKKSEVEDVYSSEDFSIDFSLKLVFSEKTTTVKDKSNFLPTNIVEVANSRSRVAASRPSTFIVGKRQILEEMHVLDESSPYQPKNTTVYRGHEIKQKKRSN